MIGFLLFTLVFQLVEGRGTTCPDGWLAFRGSCYLFDAGQMSFTSAERYCQQHKGGQLVHVNDAVENAFLKEHLRNLTASDWWMGLTDEFYEGLWQWFGTDTVATFTDFRATNNIGVNGGDNDNEDCAFFYHGWDFEWSDHRCTYTGIRPLCEMPSLTCDSVPEEKDRTCPDGWLAFRGSCYLFGAGNMAFTPAEQYCQQHKGGHLVHVNDAVENAFLKEHMRDTTKSHWWLGLTDELVEGVWQWFDTDTVATFTDFHAGDSGEHHTEDCAVFSGIEGFEWADTVCTNSTVGGYGNRPLCEMPYVHVVSRAAHIVIVFIFSRTLIKK